MRSRPSFCLFLFLTAAVAPKGEATAGVRKAEAGSPSAALPASGVDAFGAPARSEAVGRELARLRATAAPPGEVFALVTVTDRTTGERRTLTRGTPRPEYSHFVRFPGSA